MDSSSPSFQKGEGIGSVLLAFGVFALSPPRRAEVEARAERLAISGDELHSLLSYVQDGESNEGTARRYMAAIVSDDVRLRNAADGFREFKKRHVAKPAKAAPEGPPHMVNMPFGTTSCGCAACAEARKAQVPEPWDHDRQCRVAWCLVHGDRKTPQQVANLLGVSETTVGVMLERGRVLSAPVVIGKPALTSKQSAALDQSEKDRREQFRQQMREARGRVAQ